MKYLSKDSHAFEEAEKDTDPGQSKGNNELPSQSTKVFNAVS